LGDLCRQFSAVEFVTGRLRHWDVEVQICYYLRTPFVRRTLSITLLLMLSLPLISPLFGLGRTAESRLPACCRMHGKHHCMMSVEETEALLNGAHFTPAPMKCPLFPKALSPVPHQTIFFDRAALLFAEALSHPALARQTETWARVALDGARHKRGPPAVLRS
jgi:hypothetical protein